MKAMVLSGYGGPESLSWREDWPDPEPGAGEVRVRVAACGLNNTDIWTRLGAYGTSTDLNAPAGPRRHPIEFPRIQGADAVGTIDRVGAGTDPGLVGRRVLVDPAVREQPDNLLTARFLGSDLDGGFAQYVVVPVGNALPIPDGVDDLHAATIASAAGTAMRMLRHGGFGRGDRVVTTGASGGVGSALIQLGAAMGCAVTAVTRRPELTDALMDLGAKSVIGPDDIDPDAGYDGALDVVGAPTLIALLASLRRGGTFVIAGASGGAVLEVDVRTIYLGHVSFLGTSLFTAEDLRLVLEFVVDGRFTPLLERSYPLEQLADAQHHFTSLPRFGNLAVSVP